ncbi:glycogen synthase GlgA [Plasticicumulans acidivorans]|uniref:Glycogen synthase n=1 Tax=Plasticicumulans acidivorans TaxID=886464 RepID=A0A317N1F9_9GAMM|nr:glycogen synthase GlgA [Plasticicumulans acidivorans]PWV65964.1 starch synthase [Plasticicumulans acidivorans]
MKVLHAASECLGIAKTGGLADVVAALPAAQHAMGMDVRVCLPAYPGAREKLNDARTLCTITVRDTPFELIEGTLGADGLRIWLLDCPPLFDRPGDPYRTPEGYEHSDNHWRFGLFSEAVSLLALGAGDWQPDVLHLHDWQVGLAAAWTARAPQRPRIVFTIHNLAYQGVFGRDVFDALGLPGEWWQPQALEFYGRFAFMKGGLYFADAITTVSPNYAREIQTLEFGWGLDGVLRERASVLTGVLNGIDIDTWSPTRDPLIERNYNGATVSSAKPVNKHALQAELGLPQSDVPMVVFIGRLAAQKGADLILAARTGIDALDLQLVVLASGEHDLETALMQWAQEQPQRVSVTLRYDEALAHRITAAADLQLMPSRFEPCGLNQMYAQRYGTLPIARHTGGLADTIVDANEATLADGTASGVVFPEASADSLLLGLERGLELLSAPKRRLALRRAGMRRDFSWKASAERYATLYTKL